MKNLSICDYNLNKYLSKYNKEGWVKFENFIDKELIDNCQLTILNLFNKYCKDDFINQSSSLINNIDLHKKIIEIRKKDKTTFAKIYDILQTSIAVKNIATNKKLIELACEILNTNPNSLMLRNTVIRLDVPDDKRNILNWHYDMYSLNNPEHLPKGGVSMVIPFTPFTIKNGCPELCIGSHKKKPVQKFTKKSKYETESFSISPHYINNFEKISLKADPSDLIVFPMHTVHKSGFNSSDTVRVCAIVRYYCFDDETYEPLRETFEQIV